MNLRSASNLLAQLTHALGKDSAQAELRWMRQTLSHPPPGLPSTAGSLEEMVARRISGEPLQYILGSQPFGPLNLAVRRPVLIPRPETEDWTLRLSEMLTPTASNPVKLLDLCTGTGCIPLLLCHQWPQGAVNATGIDINPAAAQLAELNAQLNGLPVDADNTKRPRPLQPARNRFSTEVADLLRDDFTAQAHLEPPYDVITANPPYIPHDEYSELPASVKDYEDVRALLGDSPDAARLGLSPTDRTKGLTFYHRIAALVGAGLLRRGGGVLVLEVGRGQAVDVAAIVERTARLSDITVWKDPWDIERVVVARS
ncbi:S-adenosyl-L-methionine-dependent methyltransferase [Epithele typhae]|uniref:S-adenosyl-L-methionine-dependent methyltransferase n=1 Tax=Epithele typhae TaxID=378194 RepID=UPI00200858DF|nr:S-adenosyl-L-methionine-dependent methyltransferase [Epithele typhae]KAH9931076.1 S-adenosyl-L-methionine-dependent methyltransferase [Epithele typhae]